MAGNEKDSLREWINRGISHLAEEKAQEAQQQNISIKELRQNEDAQREENTLAAIQPENQDLIDEHVRNVAERELVRQELNERYSVQPTEAEREAETGFYSEHGYKDEIEGDTHHEELSAEEGPRQYRGVSSTLASVTY